MLDAFEATHPDVAVARIRPCAILSAAAGAELASWIISPLVPPRSAGGTLLPMPAWRGLRFQVVQAADVADALWRIVEARATGAVNLAAEPLLDRSDLAGAGIASRAVPYALLRPAAGLGWRIGLQPLHPGWLRLADQAALVDTRRAREELGWVPATTAPAALRETVAAIRQARPRHSAPLAPWDGGHGPPGPRSLPIGRPMRQSQRWTPQ